MSNQATMPASRRRRLPTVATFRTLIFGAGKPRIPIGALIAAALWGALIWLVYPYALLIAGWDSHVRYLGVVLLLLALYAAYRAVRAGIRVVWQAGLVWLGAVALIVLLCLIFARGRALGMDMSTMPNWVEVSGLVASGIGDQVSLAGTRVANVPSDVYMAITAQPPFWRARPQATRSAPALDAPATGEPLFLPSERTANGLTRGVIVRTVQPDNGEIVVYASPQANSQVAFKVRAGTSLAIIDGPRRVGTQIWWKVAGTQQAGWCEESKLVLASR